MTELETLKKIVDEGVYQNRETLARAVPTLIEKVEQLENELRYTREAFGK